MSIALPLNRRRLIFIVGVIAYMLSQFYRSFLTVVVDDLARELALGPKEFGQLGSSWFFAFAAAQFAVGAALDRYGPRRTISATMGFAVFGAILFSLAHHQGVAILAMAMIGVGCSAILMGALYFLARTEDPARFAMLGSVFLGIGLLGNLIAASPLAYLAALIGWRGAMLLSAGITAVSALSVYLVYLDPAPEADAKPGFALGDLITLMKMPVLWPIFVMSITITAIFVTERSLWIGPFLGEVHGLGPLARGHYILILSVAMIASAILAGPIAGALRDPKRVVLIANTVTALAFLALALMPTLPLAGAIILLIIAALFGMTYAVLIAHARLFMPSHVIGRGITFINFLSIGGVGAIQLASGYAMDAMKNAGTAPSTSYAALHFGLALLGLIASLIYAFAPARPAP